MLNKDIILFYNGGSGGFLMLHCLLLTQHFYNPFLMPLYKIIQKQWNISSNLALWKKTEVWPDNNNTLLAKTDKLKVYFECGKSADYIKNKYKDCYKIVIYADDFLLYKLTELKKCNVFYNNQHSTKSICDKQWQTFYLDVKDKTWPDCNTFNEFYSLPVHIKDELILVYNVLKQFQNIDVCAMKNLSNVFDITKEYVRIADYAFNLKDVVKSEFRNVTTAFDLIYNKQHKELVNHWLNLHPQHIKNLILE